MSNTPLPTHTPDEYEPYRAAIRAAGFVVNPWRLGRAIGAAGQSLPSPYTNLRSRRLFISGLGYGLQVYRDKRAVLSKVKS